MLKLTILVVGLLLLSLMAIADVPLIINYQGRLTDTGGDPLPDTILNITFSIYRGDGTLEWTSGPQAVQVSDGIFNYGLGSNVPLPIAIISRTYSRHLGIKVGADPEIVPRTELVSAPYAYNASRSDTAYIAKDIEDNTVTGDKIVDGSINLSDIGQNSASVNQVIKWNGSSWVADDDETGSGGTGDITAVNAGSGLTGGGTEGDVTISIETDGINSTHIGTSAVDADAIAPNAVGASEIDNNAVGASEIAEGVIYATHIADNAVTQPKIAQNAVTSYEIATGAVGASEIAADAVNESEIAANAVGSGEIANDAVGASEIANNAIGASEIADGVVYGSHIADNAITQTKIAQNAVTAYEIATGAVDASEIATDAVNYNEITSGAVRSDEILDGTILDVDINSSANIAVDKISGTAVNLNSSQTITASKTFDGTTNFGDSTMIVDGTGIRIGRAEAPEDNSLIRMTRDYNTTSARYGNYIFLKNSTSGSLYGIYSGVVHTTSSTEGFVCGVRAVVTSDCDYRRGVLGTAYATTDSLGTGRSYGLQGNAWDGLYNYGVYGQASNPGGVSYKYGVYGTAGTSTASYGLYSYGDLHVTGSTTKGGGGYKIDHPDDPGNMYLTHSDVSSPDMMNIYNGNVTTDANGDAIVTLPNYFESLNTDFRYQLTVIGSFAQAIIEEEIKENVFRIKTDKPYMKVSWQVTGIRKDAFAKNADLEVETAKSADKQGRYQNPELFGYGIEKAVDYENHKNSEINKE